MTVDPRHAKTGSGSGAETSPRVPLIPTSARVQASVVGFDASILVRITAMALRHRWRMSLAIIATVLAAYANIVIPQLIGDAVDQARGLIAQGDANAHGALARSALLIIAAAAFRGLTTMTQNYQGEVVGHLLAHQLRMAYYTKLQTLSFSYHDRVHTGDLMTRGILDIEGTRLWVHTGILRFILLFFLIFGGAYVLLSIDWLLGLLALGFVPFISVGAAFSRLELRRLWHALQEELGVLTRIMEENLGGIRVVRSFASQPFEMSRFDAISNRALGITHRRIATFVKSTTAMTFVFFIAMGFVLWVGGLRVIDGRITVGQLATFLAFMTILQQPVRQIAWMVNAIARASTCGGRLFEILDLESEISDKPDARELAPHRPVLRFENVSFSYRGTREESAPPALRSVSFEAHPGKIVGIVGPPGSGKSTIAHLIPRYYDVTEGRITIDGEDIRDVTLQSLRRHVNVVQQDAFLFTAAIDTNVAYGDPWAERDAIRRSTESAQLHNYVTHLPSGYDTLVGERGVSLSGGQRQRLAIARSVLPSHSIIVFDDSTASVDAATEREIRDALVDLTRDRATIIIAHRLSSLMHADEILFLEGGCIVERGNHDELISLGGRYAALHALQTRTAAHQT